MATPTTRRSDERPTNRRCLLAGLGMTVLAETSIDRMRSVHAVPNLAKSLTVVARRAFRPLEQARLCCKDSFHSTDLLAVSERAAEANLHASGRKPRLRRSMGWPILDDHVYQDTALSGFGVEQRPAYPQEISPLVHERCQRSPIESHSGSPIWSQCGGVTGSRTRT